LWIPRVERRSARSRFAVAAERPATYGGRMHQKVVSPPKSVFWFELLLYASLALDALSLAFMDRSASAELLQGAMFVAAVLILLQFYLVRLAAQSRRGWPRGVLGAFWLLSVVSLGSVIGETGVGVEAAIELVSCALTGVGLWFSFTREARAWFE
jgi:hypothetical protein